MSAIQACASVKPGASNYTRSPAWLVAAYGYKAFLSLFLCLCS